jgi:hypothetical protein
MAKELPVKLRVLTSFRAFPDFFYFELENGTCLLFRRDQIASLDFTPYESTCDGAEEGRISVYANNGKWSRFTATRTQYNDIFQHLVHAREFP